MEIGNIPEENSPLSPNIISRKKNSFSKPSLLNNLGNETSKWGGRKQDTFNVNEVPSKCAEAGAVQPR